MVTIRASSNHPPSYFQLPHPHLRRFLQSIRLSSLCVVSERVRHATYRQYEIFDRTRRASGRSYCPRAYVAPCVRNFISEPELTPARNWTGIIALLCQPDVATAGWRANEFIVGLRRAPPRRAVAEPMLRDEMRRERESTRDVRGSGRPTDCSIPSSSPEIIRRPVTKWNVPPVGSWPCPTTHRST